MPLEIDQPRPDETNGRELARARNPADIQYREPHPRSPLFRVHPRDVDFDSRSIPEVSRSK